MHTLFVLVQCASAHWIGHWVVQLHDSIFQQCLKDGQSEQGGCDLAPTIHYFLYKLFLSLADMPFVTLSIRFLWKELRFLKRAQISIWKHLTEAYSFFKKHKLKYNPQVNLRVGNTFFHPRKLYYSHTIILMRILTLHLLQFSTLVKEFQCRSHS